MSRFRKKGQVSLWVGFDRVDPGIDLLTGLCGVDHYDIDDQEIIVDDTNWKRQPIEALMRPLSYSSSFITEALAAARSKGITDGLYVLCQFDFAYDPKKVRREVANDPVFLGCFPWNDDEDE
jgi:hypothetical protein